MAEVFQMEATSGHFPTHVAAKLESWKLVFRVHQTLLFRVLRGWVRTSWATFSNIFSGMGFESWFYNFLENLRELVVPKTTFGEYFRVIVHIDFWWISGGTPNPKAGQRLRVNWGVLEHLSNWLLTTEGRHSSSNHMADGCWSTKGNLNPKPILENMTNEHWFPNSTACWHPFLKSRSRRILLLFWPFQLVPPKWWQFGQAALLPSVVALFGNRQHHNCKQAVFGAPWWIMFRACLVVCLPSMVRVFIVPTCLAFRILHSFNN